MYRLERPKLELSNLRLQLFDRLSEKLNLELGLRLGSHHLLQAAFDLRRALLELARDSRLLQVPLSRDLSYAREREVLRLLFLDLKCPLRTCRSDEPRPQVHRGLGHR